MEDIFIRLIPMPSHIRGFTARGCDGYSIYIDESLSDDERMKVYKHELDHIINGDFDSHEVDVSLLEGRRHESF